MGGPNHREHHKLQKTTSSAPDQQQQQRDADNDSDNSSEGFGVDDRRAAKRRATQIVKHYNKQQVREDKKHGYDHERKPKNTRGGISSNAPKKARRRTIFIVPAARPKHGGIGVQLRSYGHNPQNI